MKKILCFLGFSIAVKFAVLAQVANPEASTVFLSNSGYTATVDVSQDETANGAAQAIDGSNSTYWETWWSNGTWPHWIVVDMQASQDLNGVYVVDRANQGNSPQGAIIYTSADNVSWVRQDSVSLPYVSSQAKILVPFSATVNCRYYKIEVWTNHNGTPLTYDVINIAETGAYKKQVLDPNAYTRTSWSVTASTNDNTSSPHVAADVIDNNVGTFWQSNWDGTPAIYPHTLLIDMGVAQPFNQLAYVQRSNNFRSQADSGVIAFSVDGINFTDTIPVKFSYTNTGEWGTRYLLNLGTVFTVRYFKIIIYVNHHAADPANAVDGSWYATSLAEVGADYDQSILPVTLVSFKATASGNNVILNWSTASEVNSAYFDVIRSNDGKNFSKIGQVKASGKAAIYTFTDVNPLTGINYYQLVQVDKDGEFEKSAIVTATLGISARATLTTQSTTKGTEVIIYSPIATSCTLVVYSMDGRKVATKNLALSRNSNSKATINISGARGIYTVTTIVNGTILSKTFFKP